MRFLEYLTSVWSSAFSNSTTFAQLMVALGSNFLDVTGNPSSCSMCMCSLPLSDDFLLRLQQCGVGTKCCAYQSQSTLSFRAFIEPSCPILILAAVMVECVCSIISIFVSSSLLLSIMDNSLIYSSPKEPKRADNTALILSGLFVAYQR